jgi:hypothetical protein
MEFTWLGTPGPSKVRGPRQLQNPVVVCGDERIQADACFAPLKQGTTIGLGRDIPLSKRAARVGDGHLG